MIDIIFLAVFIGTAGYAVLMVWRKIPLLLQVPQQLIEESFVTRPSHLKKYAGPALEFFRSGRYRELYYAVLVRVLHWVRLWLLRLERIVFRMLEGLQQRGANLSAAEERYWSELKQWKHEVRQNNNHIPEAVFNPEAPPDAVSKNENNQLPV